MIQETTEINVVISNKNRPASISQLLSIVGTSVGRERERERERRVNGLLTYTSI